jgi:hypothetical protein
LNNELHYRFCTTTMTQVSHHNRQAYKLQLPLNLTQMILLYHQFRSRQFTYLRSQTILHTVSWLIPSNPFNYLGIVFKSKSGKDSKCYNYNHLSRELMSTFLTLNREQNKIFLNICGRKQENYEFFSPILTRIFFPEYFNWQAFFWHQSFL